MNYPLSSTYGNNCLITSILLLLKVDTDGSGEIEADEFIVYFEDNVGFMTDKQFASRMNKLLMAAREARLAGGLPEKALEEDKLGAAAEMASLINKLQDHSDEVQLEGTREIYERAEPQRYAKGVRPTSAVADGGAVEPLVDLLQAADSHGRPNSHKTRIAAANALQRLACGNRKNQDSIRGSGGVPLLVAMLGPEESIEMQQASLRALAELVNNNVGGITAVRLAEGTPDLVRLTSSVDKLSRDAASMALRCMGVIPSAKRMQGRDTWEGLRRSTWM